MLLIKYDGRCADTYIYGTRVYNVTWYGAVTAWAIVQLLALDALAQRSTNEISEENEGESFAVPWSYRFGFFRS